MIRRREFLKASAIGTGIFAFGPAFWQRALAAPATEGPGPYGPLQPPDANGIMLPPGFKSREIARGGQPVPGTGYEWHVFSDGQATYATPDGGFILVSNSENPPDVGVAVTGAGGASAIRFNADGSIADAYRILSDTSVNCAGGATPWGTWLSCEEHPDGQVWECDPAGKNRAVAHPAMGVFEHEAVCVDPVGKRLYLSEDHREGGFYRYTPDSYPDLAKGLLEVAKVAGDGSVQWIKVPDPSAAAGPLRQQVPDMTRFQRGEGIWFDSGIVYLCTTHDSKIHMYDTRSGKIELLYDRAAFQQPPLTNVDNITVARSGDVYVAEDTDDDADPGFDIGLITPDRTVSRFLKVTGATHEGAGGDARSELCGPVFDPSGERLFFASQRGFVSGVIYEITGPFRAARKPEPGALRVHIPRRATIGTTLRHGLPITVTSTAAATVKARMSADLPSRPGRRRNVLATTTREVPAGKTKVRLRPSKRMRARMRRERSFRALVVVEVTDANGAKRTFRGTVRLAHRFRRRRSR